MQKPKNVLVLPLSARELGRTKQLSWFSQSLDCLIYSHCLPILISLVQEQIIAMLQGQTRMAKVWQRGVIFLRKQNGCHANVPQLLEFVAAAFV